MSGRAASGATLHAAPVQTGPPIRGSVVLRSGPFVNAPRLYVANPALNSVTVYAADANGTVAPVREIAGNMTGLYHPRGVSVDSRGALYVANEFSPSGPFFGSVTVYAPGATGNAAPIRQIVGTFFFGPGAVALDARDNLYVANVRNIGVFAAGVSGNVAPIRVIAGPATGLGQPTGIAVDARGDLFVADARSDKPGVKTYAPSANGNVSPIRTLEGAGTGLLNPQGVAVDGRGELFVVNAGYYPVENDYITVYAAGANRNTSPIRSIAGAFTDLNKPIGATLDASGDLFVANAGASSVAVYAPGASGNVRPVHEIRDHYFLNQPTGILVRDGYLLTTNVSDNSVRIFAPGATGNPAPIRSIVGSNTQLNAPVAAVADAAQNIYVLNRSSVTEYARGAFGNVAPMRVIAGSNTTLSGYVREGLTLDAGGNLVVTNGSGNAIVVFAAGASGNVRPIRTIAGSNTSLQAPNSVAFDGNGNLYVENADTVTVYAPGASGNATPIRQMYDLGLTYAMAMTVDRSGSVITCSDYEQQSAISVYAPGASGFDSAVRVIAGPHIGLGSFCGGIAVDSSGSIFVTSNFDPVLPDSILVYAPGVTGDAAPVRSIANVSITKLRNPAYLTLGI